MMKYVSRLPVLLIALICFLVASTAVASESDGERILRETGVSGGMVVHLGCGDGTLTSDLGTEETYLVQGLDKRAENVAKARATIRSAGQYGRVTADVLKGKGLPYIDNMVNLVVAEDMWGVSMDEVMRVLRPAGVAYIKDGRKWKTHRKPWPDDIDDWTHFFHGPDGNPVADDSVVGPPKGLQWVGSPKWARHHDHMGSMPALASSAGRLFYIFDEGSTESIQLPAAWSIIARDAFNGVILWKRPISDWMTHIWPLKSGPAVMLRRLVADEGRVYVTLAIDAPLSALDAETGEVVRTYEGTRTTEEVILSDGVLFLVVNEAGTKWNEFREKYTYTWSNMGYANTDWAWDEEQRKIMAVDADSGEILWTKSTKIAPTTLAADSKRVYFYDGEKAVALDRKKGGDLWVSQAIARPKTVPVSTAPRLLVYENIVMFAGGERTMTAVSAETGKQLWSAEHSASGHKSLDT
ncbi:PQQ-binding-like beta-propeller repeat protein, partial [Candidatus Hydrogenedentota bacterium]